MKQLKSTSEKKFKILENDIIITVNNNLMDDNGKLNKFKIAYIYKENRNAYYVLRSIYKQKTVNHSYKEVSTQANYFKHSFTKEQFLDGINFLIKYNHIFLLN